MTADQPPPASLDPVSLTNVERWSGISKVHGTVAITAGETVIGETDAHPTREFRSIELTIHGVTQVTLDIEAVAA